MILWNLFALSLPFGIFGILAMIELISEKVCDKAEEYAYIQVYTRAYKEDLAHMKLMARKMYLQEKRGTNK